MRPLDGQNTPHEQEHPNSHNGSNEAPARSPFGAQRNDNLLAIKSPQTPGTNEFQPPFSLEHHRLRYYERLPSASNCVAHV